MDTQSGLGLLPTMCAFTSLSLVGEQPAHEPFSEDTVRELGDALGTNRAAKAAVWRSY